MPKKKGSDTCILGKPQPDDPRLGCVPGACETCGWNPEIHRQRLWQIKTLGLTTRPDGLAGLIFRKR